MKKLPFMTTLAIMAIMNVNSQTPSKEHPNELVACNEMISINAITETETYDTCAQLNAITDPLPQSVSIAEGGDLYTQGTLDAQNQYSGKHTGAGGTFATCALINPVLGLIPALLCTSNPPKTENLGVKDANLLQDEEYMKGYSEQAHKMKKKKVWTAFGAGTATYAAVLAVVLISGNN